MQNMHCVKICNFYTVMTIKIQVFSQCYSKADIKFGKSYMQLFTFKYKTNTKGLLKQRIIKFQRFPLSYMQLFCIAVYSFDGHIR